MVRSSYLFALVILVTCPTFSSAEMVIRGDDPDPANYGNEAYKHYRYYSDLDPARAFIGEPYDWSGVGRLSTGFYATLVSPQYLLIAAHVRPADGATVTFYEGNSLTSPPPHTYTLDPGDSGSRVWNQVIQWDGQNTDLALVRLTEDVPQADNITFYPVLYSSSDDSYLGMEIFNYGRTNLVGKNNIDEVGELYDSETGNFLSYVAAYDYDPLNGQGADETYLIGGDSSGPSFAVHNAELALIGVHSYNSGSGFDPANPPEGGWVSADTFVPRLAPAVNVAMEHGQQLTFVPVPEPSPLFLAIVGVLLVAGVLRLRPTGGA